MKFNLDLKGLKPSNNMLGFGNGYKDAVLLNYTSPLFIALFTLLNRKIGGGCLNWGGLATKTLTSTVDLFRSVNMRKNSFLSDF